jgi:hypothetical protein
MLHPSILLQIKELRSFKRQIFEINCNLWRKTYEFICNFIFFYFMFIKSMDPDQHWSKMLDPKPHSNYSNADPKYWSLHLGFMPGVGLYTWGWSLNLGLVFIPGVSLHLHETLLLRDEQLLPPAQLPVSLLQLVSQPSLLLVQLKKTLIRAVD